MKKVYAVLIGLLLLTLLPVSHIAWAATVTVNSTTDVSDGDTSSIASLIASPGPDGVISLREAIEAASNTSGSDIINFNTSVFPLASPATIAILSPLPTIGSDTTIDGSTAGVILAGGSGLPGDTSGLVIDGASNVVIKGLEILNFPNTGIFLINGANNNTIGGINATPGGACSGDCNLISGNGSHGVFIKDSGTMNNTVSGNYIGTNIAGTAALSNIWSGVEIRDGAQYNLIGGDTAGERNVISGNGDRGIIIGSTDTMSNTVSGNYIGTDVSGTTGLGNAWMGVDIREGAQANIIGGGTAGERNIISSNGFVGVGIWDAGTDNNVVIGNYVGTDVNGTAELGNESDGVRLGHGPEHNIVGGATSEERNIISGNGRNGVDIGAAHNNLIIGNYIGTDVSGMVALGNAERGIGINEAGQGLATTLNVIERNLISGNGTNGVDIYGADTVNNTLRGNLIGTDAAGTSALGNGGAGIWFGNGPHHNTIGGSTAQDRNVISSNNWGVAIGEAGTTNNTVTGNFIGTDISGAVPLGNTSAGVVFYGGSQRNTIGPDNTIAYNGTDGVVIYGSTCLRNTITGNSIYSNTDKGIELDAGGNLELFPPIITDLLTDRVSGVAPPNSTVEIFSDDEGEGRIFEGSTTTDATSHFTFNKPSGLAGPHITTTATDVDGNTSEFSTTYSVTHDMALVAIFSVKSKVQVGGAVTPTVEVGNAGSSTEVNIPVRVRVTTDPGGTEVYSRIETVDSISPLAYAFVTFDAWTPTATGSYHVEASVTLPGDENSANDMKEITVAAVVGNPEVYIKDNPQDDGSVPTSNYWMSPDIWVRHEEDGGEEHQQPIADRTNYAYASVHSIGDVTLDNVTVDLYWHEPALAIKCGGWRHIGQYTISSLAPGVTEIIHLPWTPDVSGHTCLFAQIDSAQDPYARDHDCYEGVPWDNNLAQRNVEVVESAAAQVGAMSVAGIRLDVVNVRSKPASVDVVVEKTGAFTGTLTLDLGEEFFNRWQNATGGTVEGGQVVSGTTKVQITAPVSGTVVGLPFYGDEEVEVVLEAEGESGLEFEVEVVEWIDGLLIGGNTYQLKLPYHDIYLPIILKSHRSS